MTWRKRWLVKMLILSLALTGGCGSFFRRPVIYLPSEDKPVFLKKSDPVPFDGILMSPGSYVRTFQNCAEEMIALPNE